VLMQDTTYPTFKALAQDLGVWGGVKLTPYPTAELTTGATIRFRTADDPEKLRGPNLSGTWLDEASLMAEDAFKIAIAALREGGEQGWLSATFTPKGRTHWTRDVFDTGRAGTVMFRSPTRANPFLPPGFEQQLRTQYSGLLARQELGGEFVNVEGAEWPAEYFPDSIWFRDWPKGLVVKALALDPSKGKSDKTGDFSAFVWGGVDKAGHVWVDADLQRRPTPRIVLDGLRIYRAFGPQAFSVEVNQFQELLAAEFARVAREQIPPLALPLYGITNSVNKEVRIRTIGPYLARGELHFRAGSPGAALLVDQLRDFPEGDHDDGPDALEMLLRTIRWLLGQREGPGQPEIVRA
jgi:predicted phage terminase large subunit-like protein